MYLLMKNTDDGIGNGKCMPLFTYTKKANSSHFINMQNIKIVL